MESTNPNPQPVNPQKQARLSLWMQFPRRLMFLLIAGGLYAAGLAFLRAAILNNRTLPPMPVEIVDVLPNSLLLLGFAVGVALLVSILTMIIAYFIMRLETRSAFWGSLLRSLGRLWIFADISLPGYALGMLLMWVFAIKLRLLPLAGMVGVAGPQERLQHLILPVLALVFLPAALAAHASARRMFTSARQGFRCWAGALLRLLAAFLRQAGGILAGLLLVENLFAWPGMGRLLIYSVARIAFPTIFNLLLIFAGFILAGRLISDLFEWLGQIADPETKTGPEADARLKKGPKGWLIFILILLAVLIAFAVYGAILGGEAANQVDLSLKLDPPSAQHWLGTDMLGRDVWKRIVHGTAVTLGVAAVAAVPATLVAFPFGLLAGWLARKKKWWADLLSDLVLLPADGGLFLPITLGVVLLIAWMMSLGVAGDRTWFTVALLIFIAILPRSTRFMTRAWQDAAEKGMIRSACLLALSLLLANLFLAFSTIIALDVIGLGIPAPTASLGGIIGDMLRSGSMFRGDTGPLMVIPILWFYLWSFYLAASAFLDGWSSKNAFSWLNS